MFSVREAEREVGFAQNNVNFKINDCRWIQKGMAGTMRQHSSAL